MSSRRAPRRAAVAGAAALVMVTTAVFSSAAAAADRGLCAGFGDDRYSVIEDSVSEPHRDTLGGRLSSDGTHLTAVVRVRAMRAGSSQPEDSLLNYTFSFYVGNVGVFLSASGDPSVRPSYGVIAGRYIVLGQPELVRDRKNGEYRLRVPLAAFAPLVDLSPGATATMLAASVLLEPGVPGVPPTVRSPLIRLDYADGRESTYTFRATACR